MAKGNRTESGRSIGVFDSGVGGLTVVSALMKKLPHEDFIYVGDTARVPYGTKSPEAVTRYSLEISHFLVRKRVKLIVVACNTASAVALRRLRRLSIPVIGVIGPGVRSALNNTEHRRIGVIGTPSTIASRAYERKLKGFKVISKACPLFVPLVESGWAETVVAKQIAENYLAELTKKGVDTLVLGCTHYPLLKKTIARVVGSGVRLIDSAYETAREVERILTEKELLSKRWRRGKLFLFSSDDPKHFAVMGQRFLRGRLPKVNRVNLDGIS